MYFLIPFESVGGEIVLFDVVGEVVDEGVAEDGFEVFEVGFGRHCWRLGRGVLGVFD